MWCTSCGWLIEHALAGVRGVAAAEVMFASDLLKVRYCPQYVPRERIVERVASLGYRAAEYTGSSVPADAERKDLLLRVGIAAFLSMNVMTFSLVVYASYFEPITAGFGRYIPFLLMALATPSVFYCAAPILRIAWAGTRAGRLRMESLLAMGILLAYGYSVVQTFRGDNRVYFDTACAIVTLVLTGKVIERGAKQRAMRALTLLHRLMPSKARLVQDGRERFVSVEALQPGSVFRVKSGERLPADGIVVDGRSHADESVLTGQAAGLCAQDVVVLAGRGITGAVNGTPYFLGNRALAEQLSAKPAAFPHLAGSVVYFGWDGEVRGALSFGDRVRPEAATLCADLRRRGIRTMLLSGDAREATAAIAGQIGADEWIAEALPERKVAIIRELQQKGTVVAMIGDGVNDAPSLAQADLGIALGSGADIAVQAAPLVLMGRSLTAVSETLDLARRAFTIVRQNLFWAFAYNVLGITLAMAGVLNPIMAAAAMVLSSLSVIGNSRRLAKG
jgi:cation transport ATPase